MAAVALLSLVDALVTLVSARYPVARAMALRSLPALPLLALALRFEGGLAARAAPAKGLQLVCGPPGLTTGAGFFSALAFLPLSEALAISFGAPFLAALLAGPALAALLAVPLDPWSWRPIAVEDLPLFVAIGSAGAAGPLLIAAAFMLAPAGLLTPFKSGALVWAPLLDLLLFRAASEPILLAGAAVLVLSGLALAHGRNGPAQRPTA